MHWKGIKGFECCFLRKVESKSLKEIRKPNHREVILLMRPVKLQICSMSSIMNNLSIRDYRCLNIRYQMPHQPDGLQLLEMTQLLNSRNSTSHRTTMILLRKCQQRKKRSNTNEWVSQISRGRSYILNLLSSFLNVCSSTSNR